MFRKQIRKFFVLSILGILGLLTGINPISTVKAQEIPPLDVNIVASPGVNVTSPTTITLTANVTGGSEVVNYDWSCDTGETSSTETLLLSAIGPHDCSVNVMDTTESSASSSGTFTINAPVETPVEEPAPAAPTNLVPTVVLYGNVPPVSNDYGTIYVTPNTPFIVFAHVNTLGNPAYFYQYTGVCNGTQTTSSELVNTNSISLPQGVYFCGVIVTDSNGDVAAASVVIDVKSQNGTTTQTNPNNNTSNNTQGNTTNNTSSGNTSGVSDVQEENLAAQNCEKKVIASGFVYQDTNGNNKKDNSEVGFEGITLNIFVKGSETSLVKVTTNKIGYWETQLCAGNYSVKLNTDDLPDNTFLGGSDSFEFNVTDTEATDINFAAYNSNSTGFNWWIFVVAILLLLLVAGGYAAYATTLQRKK